MRKGSGTVGCVPMCPDVPRRGPKLHPAYRCEPPRASPTAHCSQSSATQQRKGENSVARGRGGITMEGERGIPPQGNRASRER
jgi:hypothetical protein